MALYRLDSFKEYLAYLRSRPAEVDELYHDILIMVTEFFREPDAFAALSSSVLPGIIAAKKDDQAVRIWVPGCSTGEEPYSLALVLVRALEQAGRNLSVKIFATDINERDIEQARHGVYSESKCSGVPDEYRQLLHAARTAATRSARASATS